MLTNPKTYSMTFLIPDKDTLVTYYMLPLLGLNKKSFYNCFAGSYIDKKGELIYVKLIKRPLSIAYKSNENYVTEAKIKDSVHLIFRVPYHFTPDTKLFIQGKYSRMSKEAKKCIYNYSGLPYNQTMDSFKVSHPALQALTRTKKLREYITDFLDYQVNENDELMDIPDESWFIEHYYV